MAQLKEIFFTDQFITKLAREIKKYYTPFESKKFKSFVQDNNWNNIELKEKMRHTSNALREFLPKDYKESILILKKVAPNFNSFDAMLFPDFVELCGVDDPKTSIPALKHFTKFSSSEFAIRPFLIRDLETIMEFMLECSSDQNYHIRRFASEGCRPRLPWAIALPELKKDPSLIIPILENLKDDKAEYVRKSVANNLNDISKDHPELVLELGEKWIGKSTRTDWIIKHACRTMLKDGNPRAMRLFGFENSENVKVENLKVDKPVLKIGEQFEFAFDIIPPKKEKGKLRIEYAIYYVKSKGQLSKKVFQISEFDSYGDELHFIKKHSFQERTTRKHFAGTHKLSIIVNGLEKSKLNFDLES